MDAGKLFLGGIALIFIGILLIIGAAIYQAFTQSKEGKIEAGGVVFIGPIPIIWGTSKEMTKTMLFVGMIIGAILAVLYALNYAKTPRP
jgi:uncharacterized protein (TIGR00304 family)